MKKHIFFSAGLLMCALYGARAVVALAEPGLGRKEAYLAGGLILGIWLIKSALAEHRFERVNPPIAGRNPKL